MKAVIYDKKSTNEKLILKDIDKPSPNENELLIKIHAASINAADYRMLQLGFPPKNGIFGADISGVIVSVGKNINKFKIGDNVFGDLSDFGFGGFAEYVTAPENAVIHKPDKISFEEAAALPLAGTTALQALQNNENINKGCKVLIIGASGGVGIYALQLAKYFGATVTGICSTKNVEQTQSLNADYVIDYKKQDFTKGNETYDLIIGINGSYSLRACKKLLNPNGKYVMVGGTFGQIFKSIFFGWLMSLGNKKMKLLTAKSNINDLEFITQLVTKGKIKPVIDKTYKLSETPKAVQYIKEQHARGKVLIKII